jgi:hypothetical protein
VSGDAPNTVTPKPQKLAIVHLLGWMLGVGTVLAIYRAGAAVQDLPPEQALSIQLGQLGLGIAYGTAISGLGLFLWRWLRGHGHGPTQPGHWLLVLGGAGLVLDFGSTAAVKAGLWLSGSGIDIRHFGAWTGHQALVWSLASLIAGCVVLGLLRRNDAPIWWTGMAIATLFALSANAAAYLASLWGFFAGVGGNWVWIVPQTIRVVSESVTIAMLLWAVIADRRAGLARDWLHAGGVAAGLGLGLVDMAMTAYWLWR